MIKISKPTLRNIPDIKKIIKSGNYTNGEYVKKFETAFAKYCKVKYAVAMNSGTSALHAALMALNKPGKEVIVPAMSFAATSNAVIMAGMVPVFVDITFKDYNIDASKIQITENTAAILAVSLYGQPFDYKAIKKLIGKKDIALIEDASHSAGAEIYGKKSCGFADISCCSLYSTKNLMCGEGGIATTNNPKYAEYMRLFRQHGSEGAGSYEFKFVGYNYKMTELQAAFALDQLKILDKLNAKRRKNADYYYKHLQPGYGILFPYAQPHRKHVFHQFVVCVWADTARRDKLHKLLNDAGIQARIHYPTALPLLSIYKHLKNRPGDFPRAELLAKTCLSLPVHPYLTKKELERIVEVFNICADISQTRRFEVC